MKKSRFSEEQIVAVLRQVEMGAKVLDVCRKHGISDATFHNWKAHNGGMDVSQLRRLKELEGENAKLKKTYAELALVHHALQDVVAKKSASPGTQSGDGAGNAGGARREWPASLWRAGALAVDAAQPPRGTRRQRCDRSGRHLHYGPTALRFRSAGRYLPGSAATVGQNRAVARLLPAQPRSAAGSTGRRRRGNVPGGAVRTSTPETSGRFVARPSSGTRSLPASVTYDFSSAAGSSRSTTGR
jgi:putative transposase